MTSFPSERMKGGATFSDCRDYRYSLWRRWQPGGTRQCWIMLNPSTADASSSDPTIRRCMGFSYDWGAHGIVVVNLFAYRATKPGDLFAAGDPVGPKNDAAIVRAAKASDQVVLAWGHWGSKLTRSQEVLALLHKRNIRGFCLGVTQGGHPRHPLYCPQTLTLRQFRFSG